MLSLLFNPRALNRSLEEAVRPRAAEARRLAVIQQAMGPAMRSLELKAPTDTNRFVNSYLIGAHAVGLRGWVGPVRPLQRSRYIERQEVAVERQVDGFKNRVVYWRKQVAILERAIAKHGGFARPGRPGSDTLHVRLAEAKKKLAAALKNVERAQREAEKFHRAPYAIVIGTFAPRKGRAIGTQVIEKVYGGMGRVTHTPESTVVSIASLEPHSRILEARLGLARDAKANMRTSGIRAASRAMRQALNAA